MQIRKASAGEMLSLWEYDDLSKASNTAKYFYQNIESGNAVFWTMEHDGKLIGELYVFRDIPFDRDFADGKTTAYLCAFRIEKEYRGRGLGTRLMETVLADLKAAGFRRVTIGVGPPYHRGSARKRSSTSGCITAWASPKRSRTAMLIPAPWTRI